MVCEGFCLALCFVHWLTDGIHIQGLLSVLVFDNVSFQTSLLVH